MANKTLDGNTTGFVVGPAHLTSGCQLHSRKQSTQPNGVDPAVGRDFNPMLLTHSEGHGVLFWGDGAQFADVPVYKAKLAEMLAREALLEEGSLRVDVAKTFLHVLFKNAILPGAVREEGVLFGNADPVACATEGVLQCASAEFCDKVFDWWPEKETWKAPYGYHPTATCMADDNAYRTFDSYISVDREAMEMVYEHQSLRHAPMAYRWSGTTGLCRLHSVNMPLVETNTHCACTQAAQSIPNPVLPFARGEAGAGSVGGQQCAAHSDEVPWDADPTVGPWASVVGGVPGFAHVTEDAYPRVSRRVVGGLYPPLPFLDASSPFVASVEALTGLITDKYGPLIPKAGLRVPSGVSDMQDPWGGCAPALDVVTCDTLDEMSCPADMVCLHGTEHPQHAGICLARVHEDGSMKAKGPSCYHSGMCSVSEHCLAEGHCGRVRLHLWNEAEVDMEYTMLVDDTCGVDTPSQFPFTQDMKGASPWETVPDLLRAHGFCAQRHSYAYAYGMLHSVSRDPQVLNTMHRRFCGCECGRIERQLTTNYVLLLGRGAGLSCARQPCCGCG